jgi:hypothetical protein
MGAEVRAEPRCQWEGPVGLGLVAVFFLLGLPYLLFATVLRVGLGHWLFVLVTASGLWVSSSGLRRGDLRNRVLSLPVLLFFLAAVVLLYLRGRA